MATKHITETPPTEPGMSEIDHLESCIVKAFDEGIACHAVPAEEAARRRPGVIEQARLVCDALRAEHRARTGAA